MALHGVCPKCGNLMKPLSQNEIDDRLNDCEDDELLCDKCCIDILIGMSGWNFEMFKEYRPDYVNGDCNYYLLEKLGIPQQLYLK